MNREHSKNLKSAFMILSVGVWLNFGCSKQPSGDPIGLKMYPDTLFRLLGTTKPDPLRPLRFVNVRHTHLFGLDGDCDVLFDSSLRLGMFAFRTRAENTELLVSDVTKLYGPFWSYTQEEFPKKRKSYHWETLDGKYDLYELNDRAVFSGSLFNLFPNQIFLQHSTSK
jgi:hypothetical protein